MVVITILSMINSNRPIAKSYLELSKVFFQNLTYVVLIIVILEYWKLPSNLSMVLAYFVGRWSYLLDDIVKDFLTDISIIGIWREFTSWKK